MNTIKYRTIQNKTQFKRLACISLISMLGLGLLTLPLSSCSNTSDTGSKAPSAITVTQDSNAVTSLELGLGTNTTLSLEGEGSGAIEHSFSDANPANATIAEASISSDKTRLTINARALGTVTLSLTKAATASHGSVKIDLTLSVKNTSYIHIIQGDIGVTRVSLNRDTNNIFNLGGEGSGDITYAFSDANPTNAMIAEASISSDKTRLTINARALGTVTLSLTKAATTSHSSVTTSLDITVVMPDAGSINLASTLGLRSGSTATLTDTGIGGILSVSAAPSIGTITASFGEGSNNRVLTVTARDAASVGDQVTLTVSRAANSAYSAPSDHSITVTVITPEVGSINLASTLGLRSGSMATLVDTGMGGLLSVSVAPSNSNITASFGEGVNNKKLTVTASNTASVGDRATLTVSRAPNFQYTAPSNQSIIATVIALPEESATYTLTWTANWTPTTHPTNYPSSGGAHFTTLAGAVHPTSVSFWARGQKATRGVESLAETGGTSTFRSEVAAVSTATYYSVGGPRINGGTRVLSNIQVSQAKPAVTFLSMLAPSHDWFIGVSGLDLRDSSGNFRDTMTVNLRLYDAGSADGHDFRLGGAKAGPHENISLVLTSCSDTNFCDSERPGEPYLGTFAFVKNSN